MYIVITKLMVLLLGIGAAGSGIIAVLWGGWAQPMTVLCILMALDYVSGLAVALVFRRSPKTETGGASSVVGFKGLLRKLFLLLMVAAAYQVDKMLGTTYLRDAVAIAFICNEVLSLIENVGLMGVPVPRVLIRAIDALKSKAEVADDDNKVEARKAEDTHNEEAIRLRDKPPDGEATGNGGAVDG